MIVICKFLCCITKPVMVSETYYVDVCDGGEDKYRFGFNGMEKDNEMKGVGNSLDFGARMYDSRVGRWMSVDPFFTKQPNQSTYKAFFNNPNVFIDPDGEYEYNVIKFYFKETGKSIFYIQQMPISSKVLKKGPNYATNDKVLYYDIYNIVTVNVEACGYTSFGKNEIIYEKRDSEYNPPFEDFFVDIYENLDVLTQTGFGGIQKSGWYLTTSGPGGSDGTKFKAENDSDLLGNMHRDIGEFLDIISTLSSGKSIFDIDLGKLSNMISTGSDIIKSNSEINTDKESDKKIIHCINCKDNFYESDIHKGKPSRKQTNKPATDSVDSH